MSRLDASIAWEAALTGGECVYRGETCTVDCPTYRLNGEWGTTRMGAFVYVVDPRNALHLVPLATLREMNPGDPRFADPP